MGAAKPFSAVRVLDEFQAAYSKLDLQRQKQADKAVVFLRANPAHPGLEAHPIKPDKYFWEAYVNRSDRIIYRPEGSLLILVDIVKHDDIGRYGRAPGQGP